MTTRYKLLEELIASFTEEIDHMVSTGEHLTAVDYFQALEDRRTEAQLELWREKRTLGI